MGEGSRPGDAGASGLPGGEPRSSATRVPPAVCPPSTRGGRWRTLSGPHSMRRALPDLESRRVACRGGGIGRRGGLKNLWALALAGSIPAPGIRGATGSLRAVVEPAIRLICLASPRAEGGGRPGVPRTGRGSGARRSRRPPRDQRRGGQPVAPRLFTSIRSVPCSIRLSAAGRGRAGGSAPCGTRPLWQRPRGPLHRTRAGV